MEPDALRPKAKRDYVGTAEQYAGGWALYQAPKPPTGIMDGPAVTLVFNSVPTATLQIGTQTTIPALPIVISGLRLC